MLRLMTTNDYPQIYELWTRTAGMGLRSLDDSEAGIHKFLDRNPNTSFVIVENNEIVAAILAGHDGRRGYIYHALVREDMRRKGLGKQLENAVCDALLIEGINRVGMFIYAENQSGNEFWQSQGWTTRPDLVYRNKSLNDKNI